MTTRANRQDPEPVSFGIYKVSEPDIEDGIGWMAVRLSYLSYCGGERAEARQLVRRADPPLGSLNFIV